MRKSVAISSMLGSRGARRGGGAGLGVALLLAGCSAVPPALAPLAPLAPPETPPSESLAPAIDPPEHDAIVVVTTPGSPEDFLATARQADLSSIPDRDSEGRFA